jgi:Amt family ammonium transporter
MPLDYIWIIVSACFVFFMQAGFVFFEVGCVQAKNVVSVAIENILAFAITSLVFCFWGYRLMFGPTVHGLWANIYSLLNGLSGIHDPALFIHVFFQLMFAGTAVTIFAGSMSERTKLSVLAIAAICTAGFIYPLFGHWVWGGIYSGQIVWLKNIGYIDFAGGTVVHATAGWIALAGIIVVGARRGRFDENGKIHKLGQSNIPFATLGTFILWFGWFGFNGGSILFNGGNLAKFIEYIALIVLNTNIASAAGVVGALLITWLFLKDHSFMEAIFAGALGGLVAITAGSNILTPQASCIVGFIAGAVVVFSAFWLERLRLDDAVGAVPIHAFGGVTGAILLALFAPQGYLVGGSRLMQLGVQTVGVLTNFIWSFGIGLVLFYVLNKVFGLRVTPEQEEKGLNIVEFADIYSWIDYNKTINYEKRLYEQNLMLKKQASLLISTQEQERARLGKDMHDGVGQYMVAIKLQLRMLINKVKERPEPAIEGAIQKTLTLTESAIEEMRRVITNLLPTNKMKEYGLEEIISSLAGSMESAGNLTVKLRFADRLPAWSEAVELNIYRIIQESLANIIKHASATRVELLFRRTAPNLFVFYITDNGKGFDLKSVSAGIGLTSIRERAAMIGGRLEIHSDTGAGTSVTLEVPIGQDSDLGS